jgi:predicted ATP-grasp superfamily ATP-dependent carboligase
MLQPMDASTPVLVLQASPNLFAHGHLGIARSLGRLGVPVYGLHDDAWAPAALSRYMRTTFVAHPTSTLLDGSVEPLQMAGRTLDRRAILIPVDDAASFLVQEHAVDLRERFIFPEQPVGLAQRLSRKKDLHFLCKSLGLPTPEAVFPRSRDDVREFCEHATFPVALKSIDSRVLRHRPAARSVVIASSPVELLAEYDRAEVPNQPNLMLQEYIPGGAETIWMFNGYFDANSDCLFGITARKLRQHPPYTGITSLGVCVDHPEVVSQTRKLMKALGYRGIVDMGYRFDARDGQYKLLDVNPRVGATFRLFVDRNGLDVVRAMYLDMTGQPVPFAGVVPGRKWILESHDLASALVYIRDGQLSVGTWARSFGGLAEAAWFAPDDPLPFAVMSLRLGFRFANRHWRAGRSMSARRRVAA